MWRKLLPLLVVAALLLTACPAPAQPAAEEVTIRWRTRPDNQAEQDVYQAISDEIDAKLPNVKLVYDPSPVQGYLDKLTTELSSGTAPDITWIPGASLAD